MDSTTCDADLQPMVNATAGCTLISKRQADGVMVTVTRVSGGLINFSIKQV